MSAAVVWLPYPLRHRASVVATPETGRWWAKSYITLREKAVPAIEPRAHPSTGHRDPRIHLYMLDVAQQHGFSFDTVRMPLDVLDAHFRSFSHLVVPRLVQQNVGVLGMKTMGDGVILKSGAPVTPIECLHYAMILPTSVVITGIDSEAILDQAFEATRTFNPMNA